MVYCYVMFSSCSLLPLYVLVLLKYNRCFYTICGLFILQWFIVSHGLLMCNVLILFFIASIFWYSLNAYMLLYYMWSTYTTVEDCRYPKYIILWLSI